MDSYIYTDLWHIVMVWHHNCYSEL